MILADLGAEIIKVERPGEGDDSRAFSPFIGKESAYFMSLNRGKKSIALDFKTPKDREVFWQLVNTCDILVENYRPGTMEKLKMGYDEIHKKNPRMIYAAISGFGHTGPYSQLPAYDMIVQALGGVMSITGEPGRQPTRVGTSIGDITAALFAAIGILSAVHVRHLTGQGQKIDISMLDCQVAILENAIARYQVTGEAPKPLGARHPSIAPFEAFPTQDYYVIIAAGNDGLWHKLCRALEIEKYINDPRFISNAERVKHVDELYQILSKITVSRTTGQWVDLLQQFDIPVSAIHTIDKVANDPQVIHREMIVELTHPVAGPMKVAGNPVKMSLTPGKIAEPAPILGQHSEWILRNVLQWSNEEIDNYLKK
jgi:CoA:oxalate CoA-transferase